MDDKIGSYGEKERSRMIEEENKKVKHKLKGRKKCTTKKPQMDKICYNIECLVMERMADKDRIRISMEQARKRINKTLVKKWKMLLPNDGSRRVQKQKR